jgi:SAM-dependent methyltransferase
MDLLEDWLKRDLDAQPFPKIISKPLKMRQCSCCGHTSVASSWRGWGKGERRATRPRCPVCGSVERHRLLCLFLKAETAYYEERFSVLEFTPFSKIMARKHDYTAADLNPGSYGTSAVNSERIDITKIPRKENSFDFVIVSMILEHVLDERSAVQEVLRVLKPERGLAFFSVPIDFRLSRTIEENVKTYSSLNSTYLLEKYGQKDHVRLYGRDFMMRWEEMGCTMKLVTPQSFLSQVDIQKHVLDVYDNIYICSKT